MSFYPPSPSLESIASSALTTSDEDFNLDPMVFDSIVHTETPTMPEPTEDARYRVHMHTPREDWMRLQAGEQQHCMPEATSSSAPEATDRHARFFLPVGNIYFSIENTLYSVPRAPFDRHSSRAFTGKGLTEDYPLILEDVKAAHFDHLLSILYPSDYGSGMYTASTVDDWTAILHLAVRWDFQSIRTLAIARLTPIATAIDKIVLGRQYGINPWLHEAFTAVCMREQSVTKEEGRRMRVDDIIEISAIRQLFRQGAQPMQVSALSIDETCAGFDILQFISLPTGCERTAPGVAIAGDSNVTPHAAPSKDHAALPTGPCAAQRRPTPDPERHLTQSMFGINTAIPPESAIPPASGSEEASSAEKSREAAELFLGQLKYLRASCLVQFKKEMLDGLKGENYCFANIVAKARERCETRFKTSAQEAIIEGIDCTWNDEMNLLSEEIVSVGDQCRKDETKKMLDLIESNFKQQISGPVASALDKADPGMWDQVLTSFKEILEKAESTCLANAKNCNCTAEENSTALANLRKRAWLALRAKIGEETADDAILSKLLGHFEKRFRYDEHGVPRVWKYLGDIDDAFKKARDQTIPLFRLYSKIPRVDRSHAYILLPDAARTVITEYKIIILTTMFRHDAEDCYNAVKSARLVVKPSTDMVNSSTVVIAAWMYGPLVLLLMWLLWWGQDIAVAVVVNSLSLAVNLFRILVLLYALRFWQVHSRSNFLQCRGSRFASGPGYIHINESVISSNHVTSGTFT